MMEETDGLIALMKSHTGEDRGQEEVVERGRSPHPTQHSALRAPYPYNDI